MTRLRIPLIGVTCHWGSKDGGPESRVFMYGIECKALASALVLRFEDGSREAYHSHAFNCVSWVLNREGELQEYIQGDTWPGPRHDYTFGYGRITTLRETCHRVVSVGRTWVLTFRGPWADRWVDVDATTGDMTLLTHGRVKL